MEGFKVREEDNMSKPRGKYELKKGLKFIEEIEKSLKDAKTYLTDLSDFGYANFTYVHDPFFGVRPCFML